MKQVTINNRRLMMTPAVEDADEYYISGLRYLCARQNGKFLAVVTSEPLPEGSKILGTLSTITESEAAELVESVLAENEMGGFDPCFKHYPNGRIGLLTALDSLRSLAASLGMAGEVVILQIQ